MFSRQSALAALLVMALSPAAAADFAAADSPIKQQWKISIKADWPPVPAATAVVFKQGNGLTARALTDGAEAWTAKFRKLARGPSVLAASGGNIYALGRRGVILLSIDGKVQRTYKLLGATSVMTQGDSVYVSGKKKVVRLDATVQREIGKAKVQAGFIRGAHGRFAAVYSRQKQKKGSRLSPELLQVFDLATGKAVYQFRLLPDGAHRVIGMGAHRITFIDFTRRDRRGKNRKKLYFTVADYRSNKKLRDLNLSKLYASAQSDRVWVVQATRGRIFVATHGARGDDANVAGFDPARRKTLWERLGTTANRGLVHYDGLLWSAISDEKGGGAKLVGIDPNSGKAKVRLPLDGPAKKPVTEVAGRLFVRTARSIYCFGPSSTAHHLAVGDAKPAAAGASSGASADQPPPLPTSAAAPAATAAPDEPAAPAPLKTAGTGSTAPATADAPPPLPTAQSAPPTSDGEADLAATPLGHRPGWLGYRDRSLGFRVQLPRTWKLDRDRIRRLGGVRAVIPFARKKEMSGRAYYLGTVQVLSWEAAGRDADGLWRSVYVQRRKLSPDVQVSRVYRVRNVGGSKLSGVVASYEFTGPGGQTVTLRSLCVVSHGVAFEVRAWAGPMRPRRTWRDVGEIFSSFQPGL